MARLYLKYKDSVIPLGIHLILCILAYLLWLMIIVFSLPLFLVNLLINLGGSLMVFLTRTGRLLQLDDFPFLLDKSTNPYNIVCLMKIEGTIRGDKFKNIFETRVLAKIGENDSLYRLVEYVEVKFNRYVWKEDPSFNIGNHIVETCIENSNDQDFLTRRFVELTQEIFCENRSPWKIYICPDIKNNSTLIFCVVHHLLGDGFSLQSIVCSLMDFPPKFITPRENQGVKPNITSRIINALVSGPLAVALLLFSWYPENPFYVRYDQVSEGRCVSWDTEIPFSKISDAKAHFKVTANDVIVSAFSGAIRQYLIENNDKLSMKSDIPVVMSFNNRPPSELLSSIPVLCNKSGGILINLPVSTGDPVDRLHAIKQRSTVQKNSSDGYMFWFIYSKLLGLLPYRVAKFALDALRFHCSLLISNVPGPLTHCVLDGNNLEVIITSPPLVSDLAMSVSIFTYAGKLSINILTMKAVVPDPDRIVRLFKQYVDEIYEISLESRKDR